jgi:hypothetical protein
LLDDVQDLAETIRTRVFRRLVKQYLEAKNLKPAEDRDRLKLTYSGAEITIWPTWGKPGGRLATKRAGWLESRNDRGIIVVPLRTGEDEIAAKPDSTTPIVTLGHLCNAVAKRAE